MEKINKTDNKKTMMSHPFIEEFVRNQKRENVNIKLTQEDKEFENI